MELREHPQPDEIRDLSDEHYMLLSLDLANWRPGDVPDVANVAWKRLTTDTSAWTLRLATIRTDPKVEVLAGALEHGKRLRSVIERYRAGNRKALRATADAAVEDVQVRTKLRVSERGTLEHMHSYVAGTGDGPLGLFTAFLLDPDRRFGADLRQCQLASCGRFFFVPLNRRGGRIPSFCPGTDHQRKHDGTKAKTRAKQYREREKSRAAATKHK